VARASRVRSEDQAPLVQPHITKASLVQWYPTRARRTQIVRKLRASASGYLGPRRAVKRRREGKEALPRTFETMSTQCDSSDSTCPSLTAQAGESARSAMPASHPQTRSTRSAERGDKNRTDGGRRGKYELQGACTFAQPLKNLTSGSLVWAKQNGFPWWPATVFRSWAAWQRFGLPLPRPETTDELKQRAANAAYSSGLCKSTSLPLPAPGYYIVHFLGPVLSYALLRNDEAVMRRFAPPRIELDVLEHRQEHSTRVTCSSISTSDATDAARVNPLAPQTLQVQVTSQTRVAADSSVEKGGGWEVPVRQRAVDAAESFEGEHC
jgi:hypothetical protein